MTFLKLFIIAAMISLISILPSYAVIEAVEFDQPELLERYQSLIAELRCTVCQNQNLADSDAELAKDLRRKTEEMLKAGNSDQEILTYMRDRYGDFVLYRPPLNSSTSILWLGPFLLLVCAVAGILITIKRKHATDNSTQDHSPNSLNIDPGNLDKARDLLNK